MLVSVSSNLIKNGYWYNKTGFKYIIYGIIDLFFLKLFKTSLADILIKLKIRKSKN